MKLKLSKCVSAVAVGQVLSFIVNHRRIKANLRKIRDLPEIKAPKICVRSKG